MKATPPSPKKPPVTFTKMDAHRKRLGAGADIPPETPPKAARAKRKGKQKPEPAPQSRTFDEAMDDEIARRATHTPKQTAARDAAQAAKDREAARAPIDEDAGPRVTRKPSGGIIIDGVQFRDREMLRVAGEIAMSVAKAALSSCAKAELTQGTHEAQTLQGYSDEALKVLERAAGASLELSNGQRQALLTGLRLYGGELTKVGEKEEYLLLPNDATGEAASDCARLQRTLRHVDAPDMFTTEGQSPIPNAEPVEAHAAPPTETTAPGCFYTRPMGGPYADDEAHDRAPHAAAVVEADFEILEDGVDDIPPDADLPWRRLPPGMSEAEAMATADRVFGRDDGREPPVPDASGADDDRAP